MNLDEFTKKKLNIEANVDGYPAFVEMTKLGFTTSIYGTKIPPFRFCVAYYRDHSADWISMIKDQKKIGTYIIKKYINNPKYLVTLRNKWLLNFKKLQKRYYFLFNNNLKKLNNSELMIWRKKLFNLFAKVSMPGFSDGYMFYAECRLGGLLNIFCKKNNLKNYNEIYEILTAPIYPSFISKERSDLKKILNFKKNKTRFDQLLKKHIFKYSWIKSSYSGSKEYTLIDARKEFANLLDFDEKVFLKNKIRKNKLIKKYKFSKEIIAIVRITEIMSKWQDERKNYNLLFISLYNKFLKEISRRFNVSYLDLVYTCPEEVDDLISGKNVDFNLIRNRKKGCLFFYSGGKTLKVIDDYKKIDSFKGKVYKDVKSTSVLKGIPASLGYVKGKVKIILNSAELSKISKGDILVTSMTRPEHLPGMKLASAVVTDDGGITCHAAIVSRELGIPCIIGTKFATQILKDGNLVEVDANKGIVSILN